MNQELNDFILPDDIFGRSEVNRLYREVEVLDNFVRQDGLRKPGVQPKMPQVSQFAEDFCKLNQVNLLQDDQRAAILAFLKYLKKQAPVMQISFAIDASPSFVLKVVSWLRKNVNKHLLILVGRAPAIKAGCVVRTTNKSFNFGLKKRFEDSRGALLERVRTLG